jgi:PAS domain S-box-containing protein
MEYSKSYEQLVIENQQLRQELQILKKEGINNTHYWQNILNSIEDTRIITLDKELNITFLDQISMAYFSKISYPILGSNLLDLAIVFDSGLSGFRDIISVLEKKKTFSGTTKLTIKNTELIIKYTINAIYNTNNKLQGYAITTTNETKNVQIQEKLLKLSTAVEQSANVIIITDINGNIEYVNQSFTKITGYTKEEAIGKNPRILKSGTYPRKFYKDLWMTILAGKIWEGRIENRDKYGKLFWERLTITPLKSEKGEITHFIAIKEEITDIIKSEKIIIENERRYRKLFENSNDAIIILDETQHFIDCNAKALQIFDYERKEFLDLTPLEVSVEYQSEGVRSKDFLKIQFEKMRKEGSAKFLWKYKKKNGNYITTEVSLHSAIILGQEYTYSIIRDLTKELIAKNELIKSEERFRQFSNISMEGIIIHKDGIILDMNTAITRITGYNFEDTETHHTFFSIVPKKYHSTIIEKMNRKKSNLYEIEIWHKSGELIPIEIISNNISYHNKEARVSIIRDLRERKKIEKELILEKEKAQYNEDILKTFIDTVPDVICYKDSEGKWLLANKATLDLYQIPHDKYYGKTDAQIAEIAHPKYRQLIRNWNLSDNLIWQDNKVYQSIEHLTDIDENTHTFDLLKIPLFHKDGSKKAIAIIGRDITNIEKAKEELEISKEKAEKSNQLKTRFLHNLSHEIRTPMNGIIGFTNLLKDNSLNEQKRNYYVNIIQNSSYQLMRIIDDILEISYLETKQITSKNEEVCINYLLLDIFSIFELKAKERNIQIYLESKHTDIESTIYSDKSKINKILHNLIENAIKFTHNGFVEIGLQIVDNEIKIYVKDTGIGISKHKQEIIFERFRQESSQSAKNFGGLGLGLSIAKENAELLGGHITLESEKGAGSTFYFTMPYNPVNTSPVSNISKKETKQEETNEIPIILAEDENINYLLFSILIGKMPQKIKLYHAKNGNEAIELFKTHPEVLLILMDIKMPIKDGYQAAQEIRSFNKEIPIVALTAYSTPEEKEKAFQVGCSDFHSKPISEKTLTNLINKYSTNQ